MAEMLRGIPFQFEPKRENRFYAQFEDGLNVNTWSVQKFKRPSYSSNSIKINYMNSVSYVAGIYEWETIDITFIDPIAPSTTQALIEFLRLQSESITGRMGYAASYQKNIELFSLDPTGVVVEQWSLLECTLTKMSFGSNDMSSDSVQMIDVTLQPRACISRF